MSPILHRDGSRALGPVLSHAGSSFNVPSGVMSSGGLESDRSRESQEMVLGDVLALDAGFPGATPGVGAAVRLEAAEELIVAISHGQTGVGREPANFKPPPSSGVQAISMAAHAGDTVLTNIEEPILELSSLCDSSLGRVNDLSDFDVSLIGFSMPGQSIIIWPGGNLLDASNISGISIMDESTISLEPFDQSI